MLPTQLLATTPAAQGALVAGGATLVLLHTEAKSSVRGRAGAFSSAMISTTCMEKAR